ncbi:hypothetical protein CTheo_7779 [Ceratobasidium theobromae]|uniref:Uncharacterized protein n=1 Tax=Ceratobasidium theobromae TaxID=1582974 RepID=A0A5N5QBM3_9AGAM|nr:hypothetical protein CTheo_7779 [Ceratobasidium theobromae]
MITLTNTVPAENFKAWIIQRITLRISPDITNRILWEMSVWEKNGNDSRTIDIIADYDDVCGETSLSSLVKVTVSQKSPSHERGFAMGAISIIPQGDHGHLMFVLGINSVGEHPVPLGLLHHTSSIEFYMRILERLTCLSVLNLADIQKASLEAFIIEEASVNARK